VTTRKPKTSDEWTVTVSRDGFVTIAMRPDQADELMDRAADAGQPLPLYLKHCLLMSDEPMPKLIEIHQRRGTYPAMFDLFASLGFRSLLVEFSKYPAPEGDAEKIVLTAVVDEAKGIRATIAEKDVDLWRQAQIANRRDFPPAAATKKRRKKKPPRYQFPDSDAGHA